MESDGGFPSFSFPDWDPIDESELDAIEASFSGAGSPSAPSKRRKPSPEANCDQSGCRRLPNWRTTITTRSRYQDVKCGEKRLTESPDLSDVSLCPRNGSWKLVRPPCRDTLKPKYPIITFGGHIVYSRTLREVEKAAAELLKIIEAKKHNMDQISLGFDIEWRPTFRRGAAQGKAAVMQLCMGTDLCHVMHIFHTGIPPILQSLLEDEASVKVGVCIAGDAAKVLRDYDVSVRNFEDLSALANIKLGGVSKSWSLGSLTEMITCKQLEKPNKIRLGNWETNALSREQLHYAATDAYVSWYLYEALKSFPDANNVEDTENQKHV